MITTHIMDRLLGSFAKDSSNSTLLLVFGITIPWLVWWMVGGRRWLYRSGGSSSGSSNSSGNGRRYGCTPVICHTQQGRSLPLLGHAITFLFYPPWDLLTLWHQQQPPQQQEHSNNDNNDNHVDDNPTPAIVSSSSSNSAAASASTDQHHQQQPPPQQQQQQQHKRRQEPIICFPLMGNTMFSIASPMHCKLILQQKISHVHKDIYNTMKPFLSILGTGIVSSEGSHWLQQRLRMSHPLRHDILSIIPIQTLRAVQRLFTILDRAAATTSTNTATDDDDPSTSSTAVPVPIGSLLRHLTLQVISSSFLSLSATESDLTFAKLYLPIVEECNQRVWHPYRSYLFLLPSFWTYQYNVYQLNQYVASLIRKRWTLRCQERLQQQSRTTTSTTTTTLRRIDILDKILQVYETSNTNDTNSTTRYLPESIVKQVRDEMKTFMLAGHETSAALMTWTIYELLLSSSNKQSTTRQEGGKVEELIPNGNHHHHKLPLLLENVITEANQVFDPSIDWGRATEQELSIVAEPNLSQLLLIEACLKETLRKYSVVPIAARRVVHDLYLPKYPETGNNNNHNPNDKNTSKNVQPQIVEEQYFLPKGSTALINIQAVHLDPNVWPQPMIYDPYRFLIVGKQQQQQQQQQQPIVGVAVGTANNNHNHHRTDDDDDHHGTASTTKSSSSSLSWKEIEPYTFLPFIAGPRNCLGQHLALLETKMVIALLFQRYHFTLPDDMVLDTATGDSSSNGSRRRVDVDPNATSWRDPTIVDPRHRFMVPIIPKHEIMLRVSRRQKTNE